MQAFLSGKGLPLDTVGSFVRQAQVTKLADDNSESCILIRKHACVHACMIENHDPMRT